VNTTYTADQIADAIPHAIRSHDFTAAISLINILAVRDPQRARAMLNAIHAALDLAQAGTR
jgi:hypothetical protein